MFRILPAVVFLFPCLAWAGEGVNVNLIVAKFDGDSFKYEVTFPVEVAEVIDVVEVVDGKHVTVKKTVKVIKNQTHEIKLSLKNHELIDTEGKKIAEADIKELFKEPKPIIYSPAPVPAVLRKQFRAGTLFLHMTKDEAKK